MVACALVRLGARGVGGSNGCDDMMPCSRSFEDGECWEGLCLVSSRSLGGEEAGMRGA